VPFSRLKIKTILGFNFLQPTYMWHVSYHTKALFKES